MCPTHKSVYLGKEEYEVTDGVDGCHPQHVGSQQCERLVSTNAEGVPVDGHLMNFVGEFFHQ